MQTNRNKNQTTILQRLLGAPTPAKASGVAYSLAAILPAVLSVVLMGVFSSFGLLTDGYEAQEWYLYFAYILPQVCFALVAWFILRYQQRPVFVAVKAQKCQIKYIFLAVLMQVGLFSLSELNTLFLQFLQSFGYIPQEMLLPSMDGWGMFGALFAIALLPAVFEEIFFRGVLLDGLKGFGETAAALICGALFALYHQNPPQTVYQFCCGVAFAFIALRSGSILPTVVAHFLNNATILLLYKFGVESFSPTVFIVYITISAAALIGAIAWLVLDRKNKAEKHASKGAAKTFIFYAGIGVIVCALTWLLVLVTGL